MKCSSGARELKFLCFLSLHVCAVWVAEAYLKKAVGLVLMLAQWGSNSVSNECLTTVEIADV